MKCKYASYCPRRMRDGDHPAGCTAVALRTCSPKLYRFELVQSSGNPPLYSGAAHCLHCGRPVKETGWRIVRRLSPRCECGSKDIVYEEVKK